MELNIIKNQTTWNDASASINNNFAKVKTALEQVGGSAGGGLELREIKMSGSPEDNAYNLETRELMRQNKVLPALDGGDGQLIPLIVDGMGGMIVRYMNSFMDLQVKLTMADDGSITQSVSTSSPVILQSDKARQWDFSNKSIKMYGSALPAFIEHEGHLCLADRYYEYNDGSIGFEFNSGQKRYAYGYDKDGNIVGPIEIPFGGGGEDLTEVNEKIAALTEETERLEADKQDALVSGSNIKTINGQSILGAGDIAIEGGGEGSNTKIYTVYVQDSEQALESWKIEKNAQAVAAVQAKEDAIYVLEDSGGARILGAGGAFGTGAVFSAYIISSTDGDFATIESHAALLKPNGEIFENGYLHYNLTVPTEEQVEQMIADSIGSGGGSITIDTEMSDTSENAVQNKVIKKYVDDEVEDAKMYAEEMANNAETAAKKYADDNKVAKVAGKQLSTEDFTTTLKQKLDGLANYDDADVRSAIAELQNDLDAIVNGDATSAIDSIQEILAFLSTITDTQTLAGIVSDLKQYVDDKVASAGESIVVDAQMSDTSENAVQNKVIKAYVDDEAERVVAYAEGVANDAEAAAKKYTDEKIQNSGGSDITVDDAISLTSENPVQNKAITKALDGWFYDNFDLANLTLESVIELADLLGEEDENGNQRYRFIYCHYGLQQAKVELAIAEGGALALLATVGAQKYYIAIDLIHNEISLIELPWRFRCGSGNYVSRLAMGNMRSICKEARIEVDGILYPVLHYEIISDTATLFAVIADKLNKYIVDYEGVMTLESSTPIGGGGGGGSIDPQILEAYTPLVRDFSTDFNNDFTN